MIPWSDLLWIYVGAIPIAIVWTALWFGVAYLNARRRRRRRDAGR